MNVFVRGQDRAWVLELERLCAKDGIGFFTEWDRRKKLHLVMTDAPPADGGNGMFFNVPFLVVSKEKREEKILEAFEAGAEDYMIYPVSPKIARARLLRILKHCRMERTYLEKLRENMHFTPNECRILSVLMACPGRAFSREELVENGLSNCYDGYDRNVDNYIRQIRKKLAAEPEQGRQIETVYGVGYRYVP